MLDGESWYNRPVEKLEERSILLTGPGGNTRHVLRGHMGRSRQSADKQNNRNWGTCFHKGSWEECFGVPWAKAELVNSDQKEQGFGKFHGGFI